MRSISACAELPLLPFSNRVGRRVYLRVCGVTVERRPLGLALRGLSPRVRSYPRGGGKCNSEAGSISACAELPRAPRLWPGPWRVYLRVCGVTDGALDKDLELQGLSPRVRSYQNTPREEGSSRGSISACAELPSAFRPRRAWRRVYLRVCGVTSTRSGCPENGTGLSPRVRSYLDPATEGKLESGSISACAELPAAVGPLQVLRRVYLRVCGVTAISRGGKRYGAGLSPRVRSYQSASDGLKRIDGSISACAELPSLCDSAPDLCGVYLRVCGVTVYVVRLLSGLRGLSPRVRSYRRDSCTVPGVEGSISACAELPPSPRQ